jgi:hypothetical protein
MDQSRAAKPQQTVYSEEPDMVSQSARGSFRITNQMWCFCLDGFFSIVTDLQEPGRMLIRARCEKDIYNLFNRYRDKCPSMQKPTSDEARDYRWRLSVGKDDWVTLAGILAAAVDYSNFRDAVQERKDQYRKSAGYLEIWRVMRDVQFDQEDEARSKSHAKRNARNR